MVMSHFNNKQKLKTKKMHLSTFRRLWRGTINVQIMRVSPVTFSSRPFCSSEFLTTPTKFQWGPRAGERRVRWWAFSPLVGHSPFPKFPEMKIIELKNSQWASPAQRLWRRRCGSSIWTALRNFIQPRRRQAVSQWSVPRENMYVLIY